MLFIDSLHILSTLSEELVWFANDESAHVFVEGEGERLFLDLSSLDEIVENGLRVFFGVGTETETSLDLFDVELEFINWCGIFDGDDSNSIGDLDVFLRESRVSDYGNVLCDADLLSESNCGRLIVDGLSASLTADKRVLFIESCCETVRAGGVSKPGT